MADLPPISVGAQLGPDPKGQFWLVIKAAIDLSTDVPLRPVFNHVVEQAKTRQAEGRQRVEEAFLARLLRRVGKRRGQHAGTIFVLYIFGLERKPVTRRIEVEQEYFEMWRRHQDFWEDLAEGEPVVSYFLVDELLKPFAYRMQSKWDHEQVGSYGNPGSDIRQSEIFASWTAERGANWQIARAGVSDKALRLAKYQLDAKTHLAVGGQ